MNLFIRSAPLMLALLLIPATSWAVSLQEAIASFDRQEYPLAYQQLLPLAEQGNGEAQYYIGGMLVEGMGVSADTNKGVYWLEQSVKNQYALAAKMLGSMYLSGMGVPFDTLKGAEYTIMFEEMVPKEEADSGCD
ncbi:MAG: hypothetical protein OQL16_14570 [Gammaproteobacteria bacterium]|nr:hypothetical protein [Gammaproteobacteria bacterium]